MSGQQAGERDRAIERLVLERELRQQVDQHVERRPRLLLGGVLGNRRQLQARQQIELRARIVAGGGEQRAVGAQGRRGDDPAHPRDRPVLFTYQHHTHELQRRIDIDPDIALAVEALEDRGFGNWLQQRVRTESAQSRNYGLASVGGDHGLADRLDQGSGAREDRHAGGDQRAFGFLDRARELAVDEADSWYDVRRVGCGARSRGRCGSGGRGTGADTDVGCCRPCARDLAIGALDLLAQALDILLAIPSGYFSSRAAMASIVQCRRPSCATTL